jgi:cytochrome c oxidase subunit 3
VTIEPPANPEPHLAHHFDDADQQFSAGTLGMWLFLGTELLMFGGLFCVYATLRGSHPDVFRFGAEHLSRTYGALNTMVLIFSSLTMALAVRAAQCNQKRQTVFFLSLTLICAVDFLAVKYIEYSHKLEEGLGWGRRFDVAAYSPESGPLELAPGDAQKGGKDFVATCAACHGHDAEGMKQLGPALRDNAFVQSLDDPSLVAFLKVGRPSTDPRNKTGIVMPAKGGNPVFGDQDLMDVAAYLRTLQGPAAGEAPRPKPSVAAVAAMPAAEELIRSVIPAAAAAPTVLATAPLPTSQDWAPPNAHLFFTIYFCMTGLHGLHVLVGVFLILWLRARAARGDFGSHYFTPLELGGLYWHVVDMIWIFLFPLFYLI